MDKEQSLPAEEELNITEGPTETAIIQETVSENAEAAQKDKKAVALNPDDTEKNSEKSQTQKKRVSRSNIKGETKAKKSKNVDKDFSFEIPESENPDFVSVDIDERDAELLEKEAIAALPHAESIDSLIYDSEESENALETSEEAIGYESFIMEYKKLISEALTYSAVKNPDASKEHSDIQTDVIPEEEDKPHAADVSNTETAIEEHFEKDETATSEYPSNEEIADEYVEQLAIDITADNTAEHLFDDTCYSEPEDEDEKEYDPEKPRKIDTLFDFVELFIFTLLAVMILTSFFFRHSIVDGSSMSATLIDGEHLIISDVFYTPKRGDIIVFEDFTIDKTEPLVKRVIAVGGDMIRVTEGKVYLNGELLDEPYVSSVELRKEVPLMTVPEGEVFVMGDNRGDSHDSRDFGTVSVDSILGRVLFRFYPIDKFGKVD